MSGITLAHYHSYLMMSSVIDHLSHKVNTKYWNKHNNLNSPTSNPSKRMPTERAAIIQTKSKGTQVCYIGPVKCPSSKLLRRVATKLKYPSELLCRAIHSPNSQAPAPSNQDAQEHFLQERLEWSAILGKLNSLKGATQPDVTSLISAPDVSTFIAFTTTPGPKKMREPGLI
eukprot:scaffold40797_cov63-Attheya_sp.AAC.5